MTSATAAGAVTRAYRRFRYRPISDDSPGIVATLRFPLSTAPYSRGTWAICLSAMLPRYGVNDRIDLLR